MKDDNITVDEPLISTDVDSLIRTISERKKMSLKELRQECQISKKNMDKWVAVLEEEGYISVEYGLRGTFIHWKGLDGGPSESHRADQVYEEAEPAGPEAAEETVEAPEEESDSSEEEPETKQEKQDFSSEIPMEEEEIEEVDPEELLNEYVERKRDSSSSPAIHDIKSSILSRLGTEDEPAEENPPEAEPEKPEEPEELQDFPEEEQPEQDDSPEPEAAPVYGVGDEPYSEEELVSGPEVRPTRGMVVSDVRELMDSYVEEINKEKSRIAQLKKEKEGLYRDKMAVLEGRMQADLVTYTEKILEKQAQLTELKEHVLELPDKVDEVENLYQKMQELKNEGREALQRTREKSKDYISNIEQSREELKEQIGTAESSMEEQSSRLEELESLSGSLDKRSERLKTVLGEARVKVDELNQAMSGVMAELRQVDEARTRIADMKDEIRDTVATHGEELRSLEEELEGISKTEHWIQEYVRDYEGKIDSIEQYVTNSEDELAELKESAESLYLKKYLGELESMTDAYENEFADAVSREKDIDQEIEDSKSRIAELVKESHGMIKRIRGDVSETSEFSDVFARVKKKTSKARAVVDEKAKERQSLVEEASRTRKSKPSGKKKKKKTKAKSKKKKPGRKKKK
ncbi:hypothetical protein GF318_05845 [Candidatus Micrarchaeota archaeon]|nr:hypothetical protein [Candidatus Micrarchaeota archaeon]